MYNAKYLCRLCGKEETHKQAGTKYVAMKCAAYASWGETSPDHVLRVGLHDVHFCENGGIGISDFQGFVFVEEVVA